MKRLLGRAYLYARSEPATVLLTSMGVLVAVFLYWQNTQTAERVTVLERSPCQENPEGAKCQKIKVDSDRERSVKSACVITVKAGLGCPALEATRQRREGVDADSGNPPSGSPGPGVEPGPASNAVGVKVPAPVSLCVPPLLNVNDC